MISLNKCGKREFSVNKVKMKSTPVAGSVHLRARFVSLLAKSHSRVHLMRGIAPQKDLKCCCLRNVAQLITIYDSRKPPEVIQYVPERH